MIVAKIQAATARDSNLLGLPVAVVAVTYRPSPLEQDRDAVLPVTQARRLAIGLLQAAEMAESLLAHESRQQSSD